LADFSELEVLAGNREFEMVNALVLIGWRGTDSAVVIFSLHSNNTVETKSNG